VVKVLVGTISKGKRRDVQCARLDVHELGREGKLKLGVRGWLFGVIWFEVTGGPDARQLVLELPRKSSSGEPLDPTATLSRLAGAKPACRQHARFWPKADIRCASHMSAFGGKADGFSLCNFLPHSEQQPQAAD